MIVIVIELLLIVKIYIYIFFLKKVFHNSMDIRNISNALSSIFIVNYLNFDIFYIDRAI